MLRIGEVHTEVVVGGDEQDAPASEESRIEDLRDTVRRLIEEELDRRARAAPFDAGWSTR